MRNELNRAIFLLEPSAFKFYTYLLLKGGHLTATYEDVSQIVGLGKGTMTDVKNELVSKGFIKVKLGNPVAKTATEWEVI